MIDDTIKKINIKTSCYHELNMNNNIMRTIQLNLADIFICKGIL